MSTTTEHIARFCWALLALAHAAPAAAFFDPSLLERLYSIESSGDLRVLLVHRGALFFAVCAACLYAAADRRGRRLASIVVGVSVLSFLYIYLKAQSPEGPLRLVALVDAAASAPLAVAAFLARRRQAA